MKAQIAYWSFISNAREAIDKIRMSPEKLPNILESLHNSLSQTHATPVNPNILISSQKDFSITSFWQFLKTYCHPVSEMVIYIIICKINIHQNYLVLFINNTKPQLLHYQCLITLIHHEHSNANSSHIYCTCAHIYLIYLNLE